ncbi:Heat shock 70 kDa protein 16 [Vitis vinifera]|uniref:Heat shock 70 kDa protein 16 n=1 Tax=Vitis vinifera TaxID=29760 RepID=A0A438ISC4_VITVI|nr:Heat shock 70 kDa protein 16 [Vitis vinifera]
MQVQDSLPFSIGFSSDEVPICTMTNSILFPKGQPIPSAKILTFQRSSLFHLEAFYANPNELPAGMPSKIGCFTIGPFQASHGAKVKVKVHLNVHGIVTVESASLIEDHEDDSVTRDHAQLNSDKMEAESVSGSGSSVAVENGVEDGTSTQSKSSQTTSAELSEAQEKEIQLTQQDRTVEQTKEKKNALESYVYDMRNKLFHTYRSFASDQEREGISRSLQQTEDWLYEDGDDETENAYSSRLEDLKMLVDPIENRYKDEEARAQATRDLLNCIVEHRMSVGSLPPNDGEQILNECNKAEQWLRERTQQQESLSKNTDPVLWSSDIKKMTEDLDLKCKNILGSRTSPNPEDHKGTGP